MSGHNRLYTFEWVGAIFWIILWGSLSYIALTERSITLGSKYAPPSHSEELSAVIIGFGLLGMALLGIWALLRLHPFKRLLEALMFIGWLSSAIIYIVFFYP